MASTTLNLTDSISLDDVLTKSISPTRNVESMEDIVSLSDTLVEAHTERTVIPTFDDQIALSDTLGVIKQNVFVFDFEELISLSEEFIELHTIRTVVGLESTVSITDDLAFTLNDRIVVNLEDNIGLTDIVTVKGTDRFENGPEDSLSISDTLVLEFGIKIEAPIVSGGEGFIDGLSFGSFAAGATATLSVSLNPNIIFFKWSFSKIGITNIYDPNSTIIIPAGGGSITPILINLGAIIVPFNSVVLITDPNDYEYNEDIGGDFISTTETTIAAGDAVSVAQSNITIEQGSTFQRIIVYKDVNGDPVDLTDYTATMQIRKTKDSSTILFTLSTSNGFITLGGVAGTITLNIPAANTDLLDFVWGRYDLELYPNGDTTIAVRLLEGKVNLSKQVTQ